MIITCPSSKVVKHGNSYYGLAGVPHKKTKGALRQKQKQGGNNFETAAEKDLDINFLRISFEIYFADMETGLERKVQSKNKGMFGLKLRLISKRKRCVGQTADIRHGRAS